jgi:hypothetical protein
MLNVILRVRLQQFKRFLVELGFWRSVIVLIAVCLLLLAVFKYSAERQMAFLIVGVAAFQIAAIHLFRSDIRFLQVCFEKPLAVLRFEYTLMSIPVLICLLIHQQWIALAALLLAVNSVSFLNITVKRTILNSRVQRLIPDYFFEWKSGSRKFLIPLSLIWLGGLLTSFFIGSVPIAIFLIGAITTGFHDKSESLTIIMAEERSAKHFLSRKISRHIALFGLVCGPLIASFILFHPAKFFIPIFEFCMFALLISYAISLKYAFYKPEPNTGVGQTLISIGYLGVFIPFFTPVVGMMTIRYYLKAKTNLQTFLHDFD